MAQDGCPCIEEETDIVIDAESGATDWAHAFAAQDPGHEPAPPAAAPPGVVPGSAPEPALTSRPVEVDASTGATPGVASACKDLGLQSIDRVVRERGINPPGVG